MSDSQFFQQLQAELELAALRLPENTPRRMRWAALTASATALASAAAAAALILVSSDAPAAYAWTPTATAPTAAQLSAATAACNAMNHGAPALTGDPVLTDHRGAFTAALYVNGTQVSHCISDGEHTITGYNTFQLGQYAKPNAGQLGLPDTSGGGLQGFLGNGPEQQLPPQWQAALNALADHPSTQARVERFDRQQLASGVERNAFGLAGSGVTAVSFRFSDGLTVQATVQDGWYFAWWPTPNLPSSVQVTTASGSETSPVMPNMGGTSSCQLGAAGCVWAGAS